MLTSKTIEQILEVLRILKEDIFNELLENRAVTTEEAEKMVIDIFKKVGQDFCVTESTIRNKCTREIGINTAKFCELAIKYLTNQNDELEHLIVDHRKDTLDDEVQIKVLMRKIRAE